MYHFNSGQCYGIVGPNAAPRKFAQLQDVSLDFSFGKKKLYGQGQFPIAIARGQGSITAKAKFAQMFGQVFNDLFFGQSLTVGQVMPIFGEAATVPNLTPWTVTVANAATFKEDLGVVYAATGLALLRVASAPTQGQYSVSGAGVYTFSTTDANAQVLIDYSYTIAASGNQIALANQQAGTTPLFALVLGTKFQGKAAYVHLNAVMSEKLALATKNEDFMIPEIDLEACADAAGNIGFISMQE